MHPYEIISEFLFLNPTDPLVFSIEHLHASGLFAGVFVFTVPECLMVFDVML